MLPEQDHTQSPVRVLFVLRLLSVTGTGSHSIRVINHFTISNRPLMPEQEHKKTPCRDGSPLTGDTLYRTGPPVSCHNIPHKSHPVIPLLPFFLYHEHTKPLQQTVTPYQEQNKSFSVQEPGNFKKVKCWRLTCKI
jgi:hypothetical protein